MCLWLARLGVLSKKLCIFTVEPSSSTMELWMLEGYDSGEATPRGSWRLEARISLITWDRSDLSRAFSAMAEVQVEVVEDDVVGKGEEEVLIKQMEGRIDSYNVRHKAWGVVGNVRTSFMAHESLVMHRESLVQGQVSFGKASRALHKYIDFYGQRLYYL
ncbi:uncharacterized protein LOC106865540 isoform X2 [Brachypodium distachyon]|uniref:uncharacterized protein LOC106865540 isoform X2 n=1 Tax=Brachypodium distachyon TaxID=15368 RepID=UPI000D0CD475|nr:uncharacterized protein LOC106865540 isoform X2 [Brachypodium distachyon]|eukprot:XP_024313439.1 uncharacterized protein LOC106865540 isoform X2 [Brachypodium distachyon]